jgi:hypothetical protein
MEKDLNNIEHWINRALDAELIADIEHELNRTLIRDPEMMQLRDDYQKIDALAASALDSIRCGAEVDLHAVFEAAPISVVTVPFRPHRGWLMIPGAIAAALLAMVIPHPDYREQSTTPLVSDGRDLFPIAPSSSWDGSDLARPVSTAPRVRSQTGRDVIGVVGDDGNLYWIEVEKKRTVRWPAGSSQPPDAGNSL